MQVVVDTNVLISAVFFGGKPGQILEAWQQKKIELVISTEILAEYVDVLHRLSAKYPKVLCIKYQPVRAVREPHAC